MYPVYKAIFVQSYMMWAATKLSTALFLFVPHNAVTKSVSVYELNAGLDYRFKCY